MGQYSGTINNPFPFPKADIHNHPTNSPPLGDIYSMMFFHTQHHSFNTRYLLLPNGTVYGLVITNAGAFDTFLQNFPPHQTPGNSPDFSGQAYTDWDNAYFYGNPELAIAHVLDKHNAGIALTKMDSNGNFKKINAKDNGNNSYSQSNCP